MENYCQLNINEILLILIKKTNYNIIKTIL